MTEQQLRKAATAYVKEHGLVESARRIGVTAGTLNRFLRNAYKGSHVHRGTLAQIEAALASKPARTKAPRATARRGPR